MFSKFIEDTVNFRKCVGDEKKIFTVYFLHLFAVNAVNRGELFFFTAFSVAVNYFFSPLNVMNYFFHRFLSSGELFFSPLDAVKKIINRIKR